MNTLLARDVYIRLADDQAGFVCTVKYARLYAKVTEFALDRLPTPDVLDENAPVLARKRSLRRAASDD